jgi:hypothetical protein
MSLSPAAQAVKDAVLALYSDQPQIRDMGWQLDAPTVAAALRAAVDQVVPEEPEPSEQPFASFNDPWPSWNANQKARAELLAIAAELEGNHD